MIEIDESVRPRVRALMQDTLLNEILDGVEQRAIESMIAAAITDDELRARLAFQVRAIRDLRAQLKAIGEVKPRKNAPA